MKLSELIFHLKTVHHFRVSGKEYRVVFVGRKAYIYDENEETVYTVHGNEKTSRRHAFKLLKRYFGYVLTYKNRR